MLIKDIVGGILIFSSIFDCWKYVWQAKAIIKAGTAKGQSRKFLNAAIFNDLAKLSYAFCIGDTFILISAIIALGTMCYCWIVIYRFYPYKCRGLIGFRKPNVLLYLINSIVPNKIRKRL